MRLIVVSNRLPVNIKLTSTGEYQCEGASAGGLVSALLPVMKEHSNSEWIGWCGISVSDSEARRRIEQTLARYSLVHVRAAFLQDSEFVAYYEGDVHILLLIFSSSLVFLMSASSGFSNSTIWPVFHSLPQYSSISSVSSTDLFDWWLKYQFVNSQFAASVLQSVQQSESRFVLEGHDFAANENRVKIFVQDYHLCLVPSMLRSRFKSEAPNQIPIIFFLHIPFPNVEIFQLMPFAAQLLEGLLGSDVIGFHCAKYVQHFTDACCALLGLSTSGSSVITKSGRTVSLVCRPIGINVENWKIMASLPFQPEMFQIEKNEILFCDELFKCPEKTLVLTVGRLDYSKNFPLTIEAFAASLRSMCSVNNALSKFQRENLQLLLIAVPSRENITAYQLERIKVETLVRQINSEFSWQPIQFWNHNVSQEMLACLYRRASIALVIPLADGLNLVAKEFVACQALSDDPGVLILSSEAGAAESMQEALVVPSKEIESISSSIQRALVMPPQERKNRMQLLLDREKAHGVDWWASGMLSLDKHNVEGA
jgi:trehalose 6-phosphate synthase/phosphatase